MTNGPNAKECLCGDNACTCPDGDPYFWSGIDIDEDDPGTLGVKARRQEREE